jgi:UDP-glucose 6-dehydrogenase
VRQETTLVIGLGEVGGALAEVLERTRPVLRLDLEPQQFEAPIAVMHICFPYQSRGQFETAAIDYIRRLRPTVTIINSTVVPGTLRSVAEATASRVAYSPVRGKHAHMAADLLHYTKFVSALDADSAELAAEHFRLAGMKTRTVSRPETLELAKLAETSYFGVLIGFAQELNRYCEKLAADYSQAADFFEEIAFLPGQRYFPGFIGGHCVVPNIHLLRQVRRSPLLEAVLESNELRERELAADGSPTPGIEKKRAVRE